MTPPENEEDSSERLYRHVGQRIRDRRKSLNISQAKAAELLDVSYQQIQKYETGQSQLSLNRLLQFAKILNVPPDYFYEGISLDDALGERIETDIIDKIRTRPLQILLVEDNPADALLFERALQPFVNDVSCYCLSDTEKVMDYLRNAETVYNRRPPDLVILDLNLPKIGGLQLLKTIKGNSQTVETPVLILTNSISRREMLEAYRLGAAGFVQKSIAIDEYRDNVAAIVTYWSKVVALPTP